MKSIAKGPLSLLLGLLAVTACEYQRLDEPKELEKETFTLIFDHTNVDSIPSEYRVAFYPADTETMENITNGYMLFDLLEGTHKLSLPAGTYRVMAWNHDMEHVITNGYGTREDVTATTQQYRARGNFDTPRVVDSLYHGQTILDYPDYMVHANRARFTLEKKKEGQSLVLTPDSMVVTVNVDIGGIHGIRDVLEARGSINNVAGKRYIAEENYTEDSVVVIFDCQVIPKENRVKAKFYLFGLEPTNHTGLEHKIVLYFWLPQGKVYIPIDITSLVANAKNRKFLKIRIENLNIDLHDYLSSSSGYEVSVDDWENIHIGIDL